METKDIVGIAINGATLAVVAYYTWKTHQMQRAAAQQASELVRQTRLSIMPAFVLEHEHRGETDSFKLVNIGNGVAINVSINPWSFKPVPPEPRIEMVTIKIGHIPFLDKGASKELELEFNAGPYIQPGSENLHWIFHEGGIRSHPLRHLNVRLQFQDVEGNLYNQELDMENGKCRPRPVVPRKMQRYT